MALFVLIFCTRSVVESEQSLLDSNSRRMSTDHDTWERRQRGGNDFCCSGQSGWERQNNDFSHCKCSGHDANSCFALIGYPEWWGSRPRTDGKNGGRGNGLQSSLQHGKDKTMICSHCKRSGHDANSCFALIGYPEWWGDRPCTDGRKGGHGKGSQSSLQRIVKGIDRGRGAVWVNAA